MEARALFARTVAAYGALASYQDIGVVLTPRSDDSQPDEIFFRTWFARPARIRLEWSEHHPYRPLRHLVTNYVITSDGVKANRSQDHPSRSENEEQAGLAFAAAPVASGVTNLLIPGLTTDFRFDQLNQFRLLGMQTFDDARCFRLHGEHALGITYDCWIDAASFLIRKVIQASPPDPDPNQMYLGTRIHIHRDIRINIPVEEARW